MPIGNMLIMGKYKESMEMLIWTKLLHDFIDHQNPHCIQLLNLSNILFPL